MPDYALLALPAFYVMALFPHFYSHSIVAASNNPKAYSNVAPRDCGDNIKKALSQPDHAKYLRARAAHANGIENFPIFAAAVLSAKYMGLDVGYWPLGVVALRALYNTLYIQTTNMGPSWLRTMAWMGMTGWCVITMVRAGLAASQ
ncbi:MAG: hypothetical protein MMC23_008068 [Stictis urceolatum]|nr:hypothetical protein [Stictis urceolata]